MRRLALLAAPLLLLTACASQIDALAPVGGDDITAVRFAAIDVLLAKGVAIMEAPVCTDVAAGFTCTGTTADGAVITVTSPDTVPLTMQVAVGSTIVYSGSVQDVLDTAARATS